MEKSSFFNSVNGDRKYNAQDFASYFNSFIGNGVFGNTHLQIQANNNMTITLKEGKAWANGYIYLNDSDLIKTIEPADGVLNRIDRLVLRLDYVNREIKSYIKKGTFASSPVVPALQRDADMYELGIADIYIAKGATSILQANITDTRANPALCGWVNTLISGNIDALITDINSLEQTVQALSSLMAESAQEIQNHKNAADPHTQYTLDSEYNNHVGDNVKHITSTERTNWNNKLNASAYTANDVLTKIKTVDGTGSGLDADLLDGKQASAFQTFDLSYGKTSFNEPIGTNLITKQIPIGSGKTRAMVVVQPSTGGSKGVIVICGADKTKTYAVGHNGGSQGGGANSRQVNDFVTQYNNFGSDSAGQRIEIIDMYISGSNLVIVFKNNVTTGQEFTINCSISWEAW